MNMERASYWISLIAFCVVIAGWFVFAGTFLLRKKPAKTKDAVHAPRSWLGIVLQGVAYFPVWAVQRRPMFSLLVADLPALNIAFQIAAAALSASCVSLTIAAIREDTETVASEIDKVGSGFDLRSEEHTSELQSH